MLLEFLFKFFKFTALSNSDQLNLIGKDQESTAKLTGKALVTRRMLKKYRYRE